MPSSTVGTSEEQEYVLGTHHAEVERLGLQHRLWSAQAFALWERAGFRPGHTLLDVGCGPGHASFDLAQIVGAGGRVIGLDASARFVTHFQAQARSRDVTNVEARVCDVQRVDVPEQSVDGAYARWLLCFVADPAAVVRGVARALRRGGAFAIQDYFNYRTLGLAPRSDVMERVIAAVERSWRERGGDPDVVGRLPAMLESCGLVLRELRPILRVARPGEPLWYWPETFFRNFVPALVESGHLSAADQRAFELEWAARGADPHSFMVTPTVYDVLAVKP
jgi:SAM-dependent methyltransferase